MEKHEFLRSPGPHELLQNDPKFLYVASTTQVIDTDPPNVVVPYAKRAESPVLQATRLNLEMQGLQVKYMDVSYDDFAYDRLFRSLWEEGKTFILVEHDILPFPGALEKLWRCDCIWGAYSYLVFGALRVQLGCTKFNPQALGELPLPDAPHHWTGLDWQIISNLSKRWESGHLHNPPVSHLNPGHMRQYAVDYDPETVTSAFG